jgi:hypothetical protein
LTLTFSAAPPTGTNNIGVLYLGIPATSVVSPGNTAYLTTTSFTATAGQTTFTPSATYQVGYINVIRNGSQLAPADFTATNGTTVVLASACVAGDVVVTQGYTLSSIANALPSTGGTVTGATTFNSSVTINGGSASGYTGYKNRIINGGMVIDQRNNGASVSVTSTSTYFLDRFLSAEDTDGTLSVQQVSDAPTGFTKSIRFTVGTADASLTSTQFAYFRQAIEGLNFADMAFGTASAATVTVSFWVKSSVAGLYSGNLASSNHDRCNAFSFTISSANTWEQKTVTITGDLTGTWLTTNGVGAYLHFCLCSGSTYLQSSTGVWQAGTFLGATGTTNLMATAGATFQVTGVQLERGSNATSFEFRDYGRELIMCQRYLPAYNGSNQFSCGGVFTSTTNLRAYFTFPVQTRVAPTGVSTPNIALISATDDAVIANASSALGAIVFPSIYGAGVDFTISGATQYRVGRAYGNASGAQLLFTGCEL